MQIYLDHDTVVFFKDYAREHGKSFAEVIRQAVQEKKEKTKAVKGTDLLVRDRQRVSNHPIMKAFKEARRRFGKRKSYYKNLDEDQVLALYDR